MKMAIFLLNIDIKRAIFGIVSSSVCNKPINYILILARYYIYKCRISNNHLDKRSEYVLENRKNDRDEERRL